MIKHGKFEYEFEKLLNVRGGVYSQFKVIKNRGPEEKTSLYFIPSNKNENAIPTHKDIAEARGELIKFLLEQYGEIHI